MLKTIDHPNILNMTELYEGENFVYCVCKLYSGGNLLSKVIEEKVFAEQKAVQYCRQLLEALAYLESKQIIHRDLKPENILLKDESGQSELAIVDLGFATEMKDYRSLFIRCGTPGYVAPEILEDKPYDVKVDVFSAGIVFYIMLTGNVPFGDSDYDKLVEANCRCDIDYDFYKFDVKLTSRSIC